ncbi:hypothetical protein [Megasphaera vaginalis (ex Bordigoni et al. 2020)]|uniref:hypothetical protein n=1 Tax=Megasphaera vaginalis (ex Bordigoni et al. 2020) TaxID=2045301 RepID=UPI000C7CE15F|nr:hypothetical protein [Megasphaera vaginalis (ex Bordigoni et al. 2020)]
MRAQFFDGFNFDTFKYSIVAVEKVPSFFNIKDFGIHPFMFDDSCLRGYSCIFGINDTKHLCLLKLFTNSGSGTAPVIDGIAPVSFHSPAGDLRYDLAHEMDYTGSILIADGFVQKYFMPFGFQLPHAFRKVFELTFEQGLFIHVENKSEDARLLRIEYEEPLNAGKKMKMKVGQWLNRNEEYGFDDDLIAQYMDLSYATKYLF